MKSLPVTHHLFIGGREVEVIGTPEKVPEPTNQKGKRDDRVSCRVSCRALGEVDYEGWLAKKGRCTQHDFHSS